MKKTIAKLLAIALFGCSPQDEGVKENINYIIHGVYTNDKEMSEIVLKINGVAVLKNVKLSVFGIESTSVISCEGNWAMEEKDPAQLNINFTYSGTTYYSACRIERHTLEFELGDPDLNISAKFTKRPYEP